MTGSSSYNFKVVLLGEGCVGKTSLLLRYVENEFNDKHLTTLQASFLTKKLNIGGKRVTLSIWDTAGQERFHALGPIYYRMSNGAILVYDITDENTFQMVKNWVRELKKMLGEDICLTIAGNKEDLSKNRNISPDVAQAYAESVGAKHFLTSAKMNQNIEEMFLELTQRMIERHVEAETAASPGNLNRSGSLRRNVVVVEDDMMVPPDSNVKGACCGGYRVASS